MPNIRSYKDLKVYQAAMDTAMNLCDLSKAFPGEERFSLTDQMRRPSRSVCANIAEAWRKRRYPAHFVSKLSDAESEAEEARVWIEFAFRCGSVTKVQANGLDDRYDKILGQLVRMISEPGQWTIR